jgi:tetratricopeptide (TPR) repeat protein
MAPDTEETTMTKRRLILRDSVTFLSLIAITVVLFAVTLFLFRSFEMHRAELAKRWSDRGLVAFQANRPEEAIAAYRTALSYAPDERSYELMLAEALGQAGRTEESYNYFTGLWETRPGDGFINLQLARLAAKKRDVQGAINFYRASIYGNWEGDGVERRREVRLELARYLIAQHQSAAARAELLIAGGNAPDLPELDITLANLLEQADASSDALAFYQKALLRDPKNQAALNHAGRLAYTMGEYTVARGLLERAVREQPQEEQNALLLAQTERILQLVPAETLPARERVDRILTARAIAKKRLNDCLPSVDPQNTLRLLAGQWTGEDGTTNRPTLLRDDDKRTAALQLIYDTEIETNQQCTAATGDDALLLLLAQSSPLEGAGHQ